MDQHAEISLLRELAGKVAEAAADSRYASRREKWKDHNDLLSAEPLLLVYPDDDGAWLELVPENTLICRDLDFRALERALRQLLYRHRNIPDDFVIEPAMSFDIPGEYTGYHYGSKTQQSAWGIPIRPAVPGQDSYRLENYLDSEENLERLLSHEVDFIPDAAQLRGKQEKLADALGGRLEMRFTVPYSVLVQSLLIELVHLYSLDQLYYDLYDKPELLHRILDHMSASKVRLLQKLEKNGWLYDNRTNAYTGSGGLGYTHEGPTGTVALNDLWGFADAQEFGCVSPEMFEAFALSYQKRGLNLFGMACYGCCEALDDKYEMLFGALPRLRRVSVSPWADVDIAAEHLGGKAIFSWKPNPSKFISRSDDALDGDILRAAKATKNCVAEIILKDLRTCGAHPENIARFIRKVRTAFSR